MHQLIDVDASWGMFQREAGYTQSYYGVDIWKSADDLARYELAIEACRPEVIVETGTRWGGSALWFAGRGADVITIDVESKPSSKARSGAAQDLLDRITWIVGDSADPHTVASVASLVGDRRCMVSLDSDHLAPHVTAEIDAYGPLVTPGCYLVVEDGIADLVDAGRAARLGRGIGTLGGPLKAIEQRLVGHPGWRRDEQIEAMTSTSFFPAGWWVRNG